jgi:serine/threonine-protein kinase RsbT
MKTVESEIGAVLAGTISAITQRSIFNRLGGLAKMPVTQLSATDRAAIMNELEHSVRLFARSNSGPLIASCAKALDSAETGAQPAPGSKGSALPGVPKKLAIELEKDIATARLEAWSEAVRIGLSKFASVKVATAVSELARNIIFYAGAGTVELRSVKDDRGVVGLQIVATDQGPGIPPAKARDDLGRHLQIRTRYGKGAGGREEAGRRIPLGHPARRGHHGDLHVPG